MEEEKAMELEALMAIYMDDFAMIDGGSHFVINLVPNPGSQDDIVGVEMEVKYTANYPQEVPVIKLKATKGVTETQRAEMEKKVKTQAEESLGMAMIFTLAQTVKDWLDEHNKEVEEEEDVGVEEEEERKVVVENIGTPVTAESFLAWKNLFDVQITELRKNKLDAEKLRRPTGRQLFEFDATLILSDTSLLEEGDQVASFSVAAVRAAQEQQQQQQTAVNWELFADEEID